MHKNLVFFLTLLILFLFNGVSFSHHKVYSPRVEEGRQSLEWRGHFNSDDREDYDKVHHHVLETEYSWTKFWQSEMVLHISDKQETPLDWEKTEFQNQLQIFDYKNFASALYFSYNFISVGDDADEIEYKYLNELSWQNTVFISNFIFEKPIGTEAENSTEFSVSNYFAFKKIFFDFVDFGAIGFSQFGELTNFSVFPLQEHQYGFQIDTEFEFNNLEYEFSLGYLHGFTEASSDHTVVWNIELEF